MHAAIEHLGNRRRCFGGTMAVSLDEILALIGHAVLNRDATAESRHAVDRTIGNCFRMVEEPVDAIQRRIAVDLFEHVEGPRDGLVIGRMHAPGPAVLRKHPHDLFKIAFHLRRHVRAWLAKILEIGGGEDQHLAGTIVAEVIGALLVGDRGGPAEKVFLLLLRLLGEEIVGEPTVSRSSSASFWMTA